jgi:hypothetical protein
VLGAAFTLRHTGLLTAVLLLAVAAWPLTIASVAPGTAPAAVALPLLALAAAACGSGAGAHAPRLVPALLAGAGAVVALHALWQAAFGLERTAVALAAASDDPVVLLAIARLREGRAFAGFPTPAALGCFFALALPVTMGAAWEARGRTRLALAAGALLQAAGLAATQSATAVGALAAAAAIVALRHAGLRRVVLPALVLLVVVLSVIVFLRRDRLLDPAAAQGSWRLRAGNAAAAARMIEAHPLMGVGPGAFSEVYPSVLRAGGNEVRHAHNLPLELAAELGVPLGLVATVAFAVVFLGPLLRPARQAPAWRLGAAAGLAAFAIQNLVDFTAFFPSLLWLAALLRGVLAEQGEGAPAWARIPGALAIAAAAIVVAATGLSQDARRQAADLLASGEVERAAVVARRAAAVAPFEADAHLLRGAVFLETGALLPALRETERALDLTPVRPSAHAQRARIRAALGDLPGAHADLVRAAELFPAHTAYAVEARAVAEQLARAYARRG